MGNTRPPDLTAIKALSQHFRLSIVMATIKKRKHVCKTFLKISTVR